jgi:hypothetical protein
MILDELINNTFLYNFSFKNDTISIQTRVDFAKKKFYDRKTLKIQMGYKMCTPGVQIFLGYEKAKWGIVPPNGVHMAALGSISHIFRYFLT